MSTRIITGDCREVMATMDESSVDAIVTDPPYGLEFMGKEWDRLGDVKHALRGATSGLPTGPGSGRGTSPTAGRPGFDLSSDSQRGMQTWHESWALEAYRVLKPGGHLVAFGGTRTHHRLMVAIEDAGFEIRDCLMWIFGSGFPKAWNFSTQYPGEWCDCDSGNAVSYDHEHESQTQHDMRLLRDADLPATVNADDESGQVLLALMSQQSTSAESESTPDNARFRESGMEGREVHRAGQGIRDGAKTGASASANERLRTGAHSDSRADAGATIESGRRSASPQSESPRQSTGESTDLRQPRRALDDRALRNGGFCSRCGKLSQDFQGFSTALKPAYEPIVLARKPLVGSVASNVARYGTGGINVDGCRIDGVPPSVPQPALNSPTGNVYGFQTGEGRNGDMSQSDKGRWPANVLLDEEAAALLDAQSGERKAGGIVRGSEPSNTGQNGIYGHYGRVPNQPYNDTGGASRFVFVAHSDCWLCDGPKHGIMNATKERSILCQPVSSAANPSSPSTASNDSAATSAQQRLRLESAAKSDSLPLPALIAESTSRRTPAITESIAAANAQTSPVEQLAQRVKSAGSLCDSCATAIAQSLAATQHGQSQASIHGLVSMPETKKTILNQSLALFVESQGNTATIPTTASLTMWFGYVRHAIAESISKASHGQNIESELRFRYTSKSSRAERNKGLDGMPEQEFHLSGGRVVNTSKNGDGIRENRPRSNFHPTVKPLALMQWLVRLVTPKSGIVLDPFMGSGTTGCAAALEGFEFIGIEQDVEYVEIATRRIAYWADRPNQQRLAMEIDW